MLGVDGDRDHLHPVCIGAELLAELGEGGGHHGADGGAGGKDEVQREGLPTGGERGDRKGLAALVGQGHRRKHDVDRGPGEVGGRVLHVMAGGRLIGVAGDRRVPVPECGVGFCGGILIVLPAGHERQAEQGGSRQAGQGSHCLGPSARPRPRTRHAERGPSHSGAAWLGGFGPASCFGTGWVVHRGWDQRPPWHPGAGHGGADLPRVWAPSPRRSNGGRSSPAMRWPQEVGPSGRRSQDRSC